METTEMGGGIWADYKICWTILGEEDGGAWEMKAETHELNINGELLQRGFWLYVWEIKTAKKQNFYYVGRTGDSSSLNAQSPFNRMGQHLGFKKASNVLRRRLEGKRIVPESCQFRLVSHGPILKESKNENEYRRRRDIIAAMEKALADEMTLAGYDVLNVVNCRRKLDEAKFASVRAAFAEHFKMLDG
tara:strand:+ start:18 stop:584 length:567 start_codon:yes stop_codon:yes gene_type:complete